jgi:hypothetical protein
MKFHIKSTFVWAVIILIAATTSAPAQLSKQDIANLRARALEEDWTFTVGENSATSYSLDELCGLEVPEGWQEDGNFDPCIPTRDLPLRFDWRDSSGCTPVKNQGGCGSCWAFGTVGALECNILIEDGIEVDLSEQWLVSCNRNGWSCGGGWFAHDYHQWKSDLCGNAGAVLEADFPYAASNLPCDCPYPHQFTIVSWSYIGSSSQIPGIESMKQAILDYGPISVAVAANSAMQAYDGGIFNGPSSSNINHAVVLVGWDDNQGTNGVWFMRNSWGTGWGEDGYMRIEYGISQIGYAACYIDYTGPSWLEIEFAGELPEFIEPGQEVTLEVVAEGINGGEPVAGSGKLHYSINGQPFQAVNMIEMSGGQYQAVLPVADCYDRLEYYVSVEEVSGDTYYMPDPDYPLLTIVTMEIVDVFTDDFETDLGWTVSGNATDGQWNRGIPVDFQRGDPDSDYDGSGQCFLTDNAAENSDVDGGTTTLISPLLDLSEGNVLLSYGRWYSNNSGNDAYTDEMHIYISNDNGVNWTLVETVGPVDQASGGWFEHKFLVDDFIAPTDIMRLRIDASDLNSSSVVEAAIDAVTAVRLLCGPPFICGDANQDEDVNVSDAVHIINYIFAAGSPPEPEEAGDTNCDEIVNVSDAVWIINYVFSGGNLPGDIDGDGIPDC